MLDLLWAFIIMLGILDPLSKYSSSMEVVPYPVKSIGIFWRCILNGRQEDPAALRLFVHTVQCGNVVLTL